MLLALRPRCRAVLTSLGFALLGTLSCDDPMSPGGQSVERVDVNPGTLQMTVGEARTVTSRVLDRDGNVATERRVFWATQNPQVVTVSQAGVVSAVGPGNTQVAASAGGKSGLVQISVSARPVSQVQVLPATASIEVGATTTIEATPVDATGAPVAGRPVIWASSASAIATVTSTGVVTGITPGQATITATVDAVSGSSAVTVTPVPVATVTVSPTTGSIEVGRTLQLSATTASAGGQTLTGRIVTWSSSDNGVATVSSTGLVIAVGPGSTTITATSEGKSGAAQVTVSAVPVASIRVIPSNLTLASGATQQLAAQALDAGGNLLNRTIAWSSDQPTVATVSASGLLTAVNTGTARITASVGSVSGQATVTVTPVPVASITIVPNGASLLVGTTQQLSATAKDANNVTLPGRTITWISGAPSVATVSQSGLVTAVGAGSAVVFAASEGVSASVTITVSTVGVAAVRVTPATATVQQGQGVQLAAAALDAGGNVLAGKIVIWTSSDETIGTVSSTGRVTGIAPGSITVTATVDGVNGTASVTVTQVPVASVTIAPASATLNVGQTLQLTPNLFSSGGAPLPLTGRTVTWRSLDPGVAMVSSSGLVTAVASGTVTIEVEVEGVKGTSVITVSAVAVATVTLTPPSASINVGQALGISATARDASGNVLSGRPVTWSSDDVAVVTVNTATTLPTNTLTGVAAGSASVRATIGGVQGSAAVTVTLIPIASIVVSPTPSSIEEGTSVTLTATAFDGSNTPLVGRTIVWASNNPNVNVSQTGVVTAVLNSSPGQSATITASSPGGGVGGSTPAGSATVNATYAPVATVTLAPPTPLTVSVGATTQFSPTLRNAAGLTLESAGRTLAWSSLTPAIASVDAAGVITGVAPGGPVTIQLAANSPGQATAVVASGSVTVTNVSIATISVSPNPGTVHVGSLYKRQFTAVARDAQGNVLTGRLFQWISLTPATATVDIATGEVTGLTVGGPVTIRATADGVNGDAQVTVDLVPVSTVTVAPGAATLNPLVNATQQLTATPLDSAGNVISGPALGGRAASWSSNNLAAATVNATTGLVTAVAAGTATITGTIGGIGGTSAITVIAGVSQVALDISPDSLILPGTLSGTVTVRDASSNLLAGRTVTLNSSNAAVASVSPATAASDVAGQVALTVTGVGQGSTIITATSEGASQTLTVRMLSPVSGVVVTANPDSVIGTGAAPVQATVTLLDAASQPITGRPVAWTSSAPGVATVNSTTGLITPASLGTTTISASSGGVSGGIIFRVLPPVASITVTTPGDSVLGTGTLPATATLRDATTTILTGRPITWNSSNTGVATVSTTGLITGVAAGNVTITATSEGQSAAVVVRVLAGITAILLTPAGDSLIGPGSLALTATAISGATAAQGRSLTVTSSNPAVGTLPAPPYITNANGQVALPITYVAAGTTTLDVSADGQQVSRVIRMMAPVASVTLTAPGDSIIGTGTLQATVDVRDAGNTPLTNRLVVWTVPVGGTFALVSPTGVITGVAPGTALVVATAETRADTLTIRVLAPVNSVDVTAADSSVFVAQTQQATAVLRDAANAVITGRPIAWSSTNPAKATVSSTGLITAVDSGTTTITATAEGKSASFVFTVSLVPTKTVTVAPATAALTVGGGTSTRAFTATLTDSVGNVLTGRVVNWASSNTGKLTISSSGLATAVDSGSVTVTASTSPGTPVSPVSGTATVTITLVPVGSITAGNINVKKGSTANLVATVLTTGGLPAIGRACTASSSSTATFTVSPAAPTALLTSATGTATFVVTGTVANPPQQGTATILCEGVSLNVQVNVTP